MFLAAVISSGSTQYIRTVGGHTNFNTLRDEILSPEHAKDNHIEGYDTIVIEEIKEGFPASVVNQIWFSWNYSTDKWVYGTEPEWAKGVKAWTIGADVDAVEEMEAA